MLVVGAAIALPQPSAFEVASIKSSGPQSVRGSDGGPGSPNPGRYIFNSASLLDLIAVAYEVPAFRISSPEPLDRQHFDLAAKLPPGATKEQFREMLRNLLAERFLLKLHIQSKEFQAYELVIAKSGSKLKDGVTAGPPAGDGWPELPPNRPTSVSRYSVSGAYQLVRVRARQQTLAALASSILRADLPVVDKTGLTGKYDFNLEYSIDMPGAARHPVGPTRRAEYVHGVAATTRASAYPEKGPVRRSCH